MINHVFIGTSTPMLYYINYLIYKKKINDNIIIVEKNENKIGGSWNYLSNKYCSKLDSAIHFITIKNNYDKIIKGFNNFDIELCKFDTNNLNIEYDNYKQFLDKGLLFAKEGWANLTYKLYSKLLKNKNITFLFKKIDKINIKSEFTELYYDEKCIKTKKVYIPSYISNNEIYINNKKIILKNDNNKFTPIKTIHLILYLKTNNIKHNENFHSIYDDIYLFDRVMFVTDNIINDNVNLICILRISRSYKNKVLNIPNIGKEALYFLYFKKLITNSIVIDKEITQYVYNFRFKSFIENKNNIKQHLQKNNISDENIELLDTRDFGPLVELYN